MKLTRVSFSFALFKSSVGLLSEVDIPVDGRGFETMTFKALHSYLAYMTVSSVKSGIAGSFKINYMYSKSFFLVLF